ncbi:MAG: beta-ketoacyl-[acyl-carrier-protein] synthase family protein [Phycisphaeraceae bacterium]|nr:hypothetical protein [Phycisphaerales bacterium]QOJ16917.1 MAG: beta-ketoacyl-[acyl-carrier-protein] synthase family protein [Phycisphaeraceae bacterium]
MSKRSVVITGIGPITAFGLGIDPLWSALIEGRSAIAPISRFNPSSFPCRLGAELPDDRFNVRDVVPKNYRKATKVMARDIELAVGAALAAVQDAGLNTKGIDPDQPPTIDPDRFGCHIGAGLIAADVEELAAAFHESRTPDGEFDLHVWGARGMENLTPLWLLKYLPNMLACHVTIIHDCRGPSNTITCNEASALLSLGESVRVIERGQAIACLTGGAEYKLNPMGVLRQHFARRLAPTPDGVDPATVVRPFDPAAVGSVLGEGGGILVVEAEDSAAARGARVYARVAGFGSSQSFCPDTVGLAPDPDDTGIDAAIENALRDGGLGPESIDAIVPFGSGIPSVDAAEAAAIRRVFGPRAADIPLVTVVPNVGNCCAGMAAVSMCVAAKCLREQMLPARLSATVTPGLNAAAAPARPALLRHVLVMVTSMGGQNAAVVMGRG